MSDVRILIVDDYPDNLLALEAILKGTGYAVVRANSGREALKAMLAQDFALVLMDVLKIGQVTTPAAHQEFRAAGADGVVAAAAGGRFAVVIFRQKRQREDVAPHLPRGGDLLVIGTHAQRNV